jgi:hypothetical protein
MRAPLYGANRSRFTLHMPSQPIAFDAGGVRSISRRGQNLRLGPLSATVQTTDFPLATLVTRSRWPIGSSMCAQTKSRSGYSRLPSAAIVSSNSVATPPYGGGLMRVSQRSSNVSARAHTHVANSVSAESMSAMRASMAPILPSAYGRDRDDPMPIFRPYQETVATEPRGVTNAASDYWYIECSVMAFVSIAFVSIAAAISLLIVAYLARRGYGLLAFLFINPSIDLRGCDRTSTWLVRV